MVFTYEVYVRLCTGIQYTYKYDNDGKYYLSLAQVDQRTNTLLNLLDWHMVLFQIVHNYASNSNPLIAIGYIMKTKFQVGKNLNYTMSQKFVCQFINGQTTYQMLSGHSLGPNFLNVSSMLKPLPLSVWVNPGLAILPGPGFPTPGKTGLGNNAFLTEVGNNGQ